MATYENFHNWQPTHVSQFKRKDQHLGYLDLITSEQYKSGGVQDLVSGFKNPFVDSISGSLEAATANIRSRRGAMDGIEGDVRNSALARTQGAQVAALNAARMTSGRGGTAFGGGSKAIATRAAQQAASGQSAALAQALLQGRQMRTTYDLQQAGAEGSLAQAMANARKAQAQMSESNINRQFSAKTGFQEMMVTMAGVGKPAQRKKTTSYGPFGEWG